MFLLHYKFMKVKGLVEVYKNGKLQGITENNFLMSGEDIIALFLSKSFANKYDQNEGAVQSGYFDFVAIGTGFKAPIDGANNVIVLPNKPIGVLDEQIDIYDNATVKIHSGSNAGVTTYVAENGYNPANADYENKPTITLGENLGSIVEAGVQFTIGSRPGESALQGERRSDFKGASFLNNQSWRWAIENKKVLDSNTTPAGATNEVYFTVTIDQPQLSGAESILITEALICNSLTPAASSDVKSGIGLARCLITPTEIAADDAVVIRWRLRIGTQRELSI